MYVGEVVDVEGISTGYCMVEYSSSDSSTVGSRKYICDDGEEVYLYVCMYVCMYVYGTTFMSICASMYV